MGIEARGADVRKGPDIRFGIRWDDGRRLKRGVLALAVAIALLAVPAGAAQADVLVVAKAHRVAAAERATERAGGRVQRRAPIVNGFTAKVPRGAVSRLARAHSVRAVSRDGAIKLNGTDPGAEKAIASSDLVRTAIGADGSELDGAGIGVAVLDSGAVAVGSLERPGALVHGPDFSSEADDPDLAGLDTFGHGTHVAGLIAGVAPGAHVVSVKVAGADGVTSLGQVLMGLSWIRAHRDQHDIRVVNLSLGTDESDDYRHDILAWAAEQLWKDGIAVVAAAGNKGAGSTAQDLPAADPFVIAVGATDTADTPDPADDTVADFSSRSAVRAPDVLAPGTGIVSLRVPGSTLDTEFPGARVGDGYFRGSGTSQAAAIVSGVAARLLEQRPSLTGDQLKALLVEGAAPMPGPESATGAGRVDLARSAALRTPPRGRVKQRFPAAELDLSGLADEIGAGDFWDGRRWSGMKWSGRRWSGMKWAGMKWSGMKWSGAGWDGDAAG
jgi:serine protease AprX